MDINEITPVHKILFEMYNTFAVGEDFNYDDLDYLDPVPYSDYYMRHMTHWSNYDDEPIDKFVEPMYKKLTLEQKNDLLKILANNAKFRFDNFHSYLQDDFTEEEQENMEDEEVAAYLTEKYLHTENTSDELEWIECELIGLISKRFREMLEIFGYMNSESLNREEHESSIISEIGVLLDFEQSYH